MVRFTSTSVVAIALVLLIQSSSASVWDPVTAADSQVISDYWDSAPSDFYHGLDNATAGARYLHIPTEAAEMIPLSIRGASTNVTGGKLFLKFGGYDALRQMWTTAVFLVQLRESDQTVRVIGQLATYPHVGQRYAVWCGLQNNDTAILFSRDTIYSLTLSTNTWATKSQISNLPTEAITGFGTADFKVPAMCVPLGSYSDTVEDFGGSFLLWVGRPSTSPLMKVYNATADSWDDVAVNAANRDVVVAIATFPNVGGYANDTDRCIAIQFAYRNTTATETPLLSVAFAPICTRGSSFEFVTDAKGGIAELQSSSTPLSDPQLCGTHPSAAHVTTSGGDVLAPRDPVQNLRRFAGAVDSYDRCCTLDSETIAFGHSNLNALVVETFGILTDTNGFNPPKYVSGAIDGLRGPTNLAENPFMSVPERNTSVSVGPSQLHVFDHSTFRWTSTTVPGVYSTTDPSVSVSAIDGGSLIAFGGVTGAGTCTQRVVGISPRVGDQRSLFTEYFDPEPALLAGTAMPTGRQEAFATSVSISKVLVGGGNCGASFFSDLWVFDVLSREWTPVTTKLLSADLEADQLAVAGASATLLRPETLNSDSAVVAVIGGKTSTGYTSSAIVLLSINLATMEANVTLAAGPTSNPPRAGHVGMSIGLGPGGPGALIIVGGSGHFDTTLIPQFVDDQFIATVNFKADGNVQITGHSFRSVPETPDNSTFQAVRTALIRGILVTFGPRGYANGFFVASTTAGTLACPQGSIRDVNISRLSCSPCGAGTYFNESSAVGACVPCPAGFGSPEASPSVSYCYPEVNAGNSSDASTATSNASFTSQPSPLTIASDNGTATNESDTLILSISTEAQSGLADLSSEVIQRQLNGTLIACYVLAFVLVVLAAISWFTGKEWQENTFRPLDLFFDEVHHIKEGVMYKRTTVCGGMWTPVFLIVLGAFVYRAALPYVADNVLETKSLLPPTQLREQGRVIPGYFTVDVRWEGYRSTNSADGLGCKENLKVTWDGLRAVDAADPLPIQITSDSDRVAGTCTATVTCSGCLLSSTTGATSITISTLEAASSATSLEAVITSVSSFESQPSYAKASVRGLQTINNTINNVLQGTQLVEASVYPEILYDDTTEITLASAGWSTRIDTLTAATTDDVQVTAAPLQLQLILAQSRTVMESVRKNKQDIAELLGTIAGLAAGIFAVFGILSKGGEKVYYVYFLMKEKKFKEKKMTRFERFKSAFYALVKQLDDDPYDTRQRIGPAMLAEEQREFQRENVSMILVWVLGVIFPETDFSDTTIPRIDESMFEVSATKILGDIGDKAPLRQIFKAICKSAGEDQPVVSVDDIAQWSMELMFDDTKFIAEQTQTLFQMQFYAQLVVFMSRTAAEASALGSVASFRGRRESTTFSGTVRSRDRERLAAAMAHLTVETGANNTTTTAASDNHSFRTDGSFDLNATPKSSMLVSRQMKSFAFMGLDKSTAELMPDDSLQKQSSTNEPFTFTINVPERTPQNLSFPVITSINEPELHEMDREETSVHIEGVPYQKSPNGSNKSSRSASMQHETRHHDPLSPDMQQLTSDDEGRPEGRGRLRRRQLNVNRARPDEAEATLPFPSGDQPRTVSPRSTSPPAPRHGRQGTMAPE